MDIIDMSGMNAPKSHPKELEMEALSGEPELRKHSEVQQPADCSDRPPHHYTVDDIVNEVGFGAYQTLLMVLCGAGWAADIMDIQAISFLLPTLKEEWGETNERLGLAASFTFFGMLLGSMFWGVISDRIGRRPAFMMTTLIAGGCGMLAATSNNIVHLVGWRCAQGFGLGGNLAVDFSLFLEFVPTASRGRKTVLLTMFATFGSLTASGLAWLLMESAGWRVFLVLCSAPGLLIALGRAYMYESPHFLANAGRREECLRVLQRVAAMNGATISVASAAQIQGSAVGRLPLRSALASMVGPTPLRGKLVGSCIHWFFLSLGFYGFSVWGPSYFQERGFKPQESYEALFSSVACQFPGTLLAAKLVERVGRVKLLVGFAVSCCVMVSGVALSTSQAMMVAFSLALNFSTAALWAVTYTYTPEIFPTQVRTTAMGACACMARVAGILVSYLGGLLLSTSLELSLGAYSVAYGVCAVTILFLGVEMSGVPLSKLDVGAVAADDHEALTHADQLSDSRP